MFRKLSVRFDNRERFVQEYQRNLANGGIFVPTDEIYDPCEVVEVQLDLRFCDRQVTLQAEAVSRVDTSFGPAGGRPGVALQFLVPADELRQALGELAGVEPPPPPVEDWPERDGAARRMERFDACLAIRVECRGHSLTGRTRNLSRSGALVYLDGIPLPVGERFELTLLHPTSFEELPLDAIVRRHVETEGRVAAMGVEYDLDEESAEATVRQIDDLRAAAHAHQLAGIRGPIEALGLPNLLQMFATASEAGTLMIMQGDQQGRVVFENGALRHSVIGTVSGMKALARMIAWRDGEFWFLPGLDPDAPGVEPTAVSGAVLEAVTQLDELARLDLASLPGAARIVREIDVPDPEDPDKIEATVLDLSTGRATVGAILDSVAEYDSLVYGALLQLLERGLIRTELEEAP